MCAHFEVWSVTEHECILGTQGVHNVKEGPVNPSDAFTVVTVVAVRTVEGCHHTG